MGLHPSSWIDRKARHRAHDHWARMAARTDRLGPGRLSNLREEAMSLKRNLDRFLLGADRRVAASRAELSSLPLPGGTDWRWRPEILAGRVSPTGLAAPESGARLGETATVWHDCPESAMILRQVQNAQATDLAAFGLRLEVLGFSGNFLSVAIDIPEAALDGLTRNHIIRVETAIQIEREMEIYTRLNIGNGPNTEKLTRHLGGMAPGQVNHHVTEFDLAQTEMNENRLEKIWLDLIFERPVMNAVNIREMIVSRHPRANL